MKKSTMESASHLRGLATLCMALGLATFILAILGIVLMCISNKNTLDQAYSGFLIAEVILGGLMFLFVGYVGYVQLFAYATFLENSDRTEVVEAINELTDVISELLPQDPRPRRRRPDIVPSSETVIETAVEAMKERDAREQAAENIEINDD